MPSIRTPAGTAACCMLFLAIGLGGTAGAVGTVPPNELVRGDTLTGVTTLSPEGLTSFELVVVGVVEGSAPGRDLIVARALGDEFAEVGIVQGMSGSPVYLGERLVGAVAAAWSFSKLPMAAITPIGNMLALAEESDDTRRAAADAPTASELIPAEERGSSRTVLLSRRSRSPRHEVSTRGRHLGSLDGRELDPLTVPVSTPGSPAFRERLRPYLESIGFAPVAGRGTGGRESAGEFDLDSIRPGSPIGVGLVGGDLVWAATGTVTHREGDTILAFGHPLFESGPTSLPLVSASVLDVVPLQSVSFRLTSTGDAVGTLLRDGAAGVVGELGDSPPGIPVILTLKGPGFDTSYEFSVIRLRPYSFLFASLASAGVVSEVYRTSGRASVRLDVVVRTDEETVRYHDVFATSEPALRLGGELATLLGVLGDSGLAERTIESVEIDADFSDDWRWYAIERVAVDRPVVSPGEDITLRVTLRPWQGEAVTRELVLSVPTGTPEGELYVRVGGAADYHAWDADRLGGGAAPRTYRQLVRLVEASLPGSRLVAQALSEKRSLTLAGEEIGSPPGRAAIAMGAGGAGGAAEPTDMSVVAETTTDMEHEVAGFHEIVIKVSDR